MSVLLNMRISALGPPLSNPCFRCAALEIGVRGSCAGMEIGWPTE
jgi:hypothetical protein